MVRNILRPAPPGMGARRDLHSVARNRSDDSALPAPLKDSSCFADALSGVGKLRDRTKLRVLVSELMQLIRQRICWTSDPIRTGRMPMAV